MPEPAVLTERDGHLLIVTLNRPERQNAINGEMLVRFLDACIEADENPDIRALVLTGAGGNFCSGADLKDMAGGHEPDPDSDIDVQARMAEDPELHWKALLRTWRPHVPIILAAEGTAIAGGTELLGATEIRVAGRSAKFGISEVRWSLYPMGGSAVRIPRQIPYTVACELLLTGDHITARTCTRARARRPRRRGRTGTRQGCRDRPAHLRERPAGGQRRCCAPSGRPTACARPRRWSTSSPTVGKCSGPRTPRRARRRSRRSARRTSRANRRPASGCPPGRQPTQPPWGRGPTLRRRRPRCAAPGCPPGRQPTRPPWGRGPTLRRSARVRSPHRAGSRRE